MANILLIDDEKSIRKTLKEILEYEGYVVDEAGDGAEGLRMIQEGDYDIALCDIKMPKMDGEELLEAVKKIKPNIVHAQLFEAGLIGISAAWLAGIKYRIYTRHYSNYHHKFAPSGIKYDKWINSKSTHIVSITKMVSDILIQKENVSPEKITLIYHGFPFDNFNNISEERIKTLLSNNTDVYAAEIITDLILERQKQKAISRQQFKSQQHIVDDEEAW